MNLFVETFGCQMNAADSEEMAGALIRKGAKITSERSKADVLILNTCTVRDHAEQKALSYLGRLKDWKKHDHERVLIVAGCAAERMKPALKSRFPYVDLVVGAKSIDEFPGIVEKFFVSRKNGFAPGAVPEKHYDWFRESERAFEGSESRREGEPLVLGREGETAFVTVMRGCNYSCSYCIVPSVRGREKYRDPGPILSEVRRKAAAGASKVMLLGQTVNSYWHRGDGGMTDFSDLLERTAALPEVEEIKFMSPHPHYMSPKLISTLSSVKKISPEIHLPVQSGSDRVLKMMKRNYSREEYAGTAQALKAGVRGLKLSTDFIVGFPGETEEDFQATLSLVEQVRFSMAFCFKYSPRSGTESSCFSDDVARKVKEERLSRLLAAVEKAKS